MENSHREIDQLSQDYQKTYAENKVILSFNQFLETVKENPRRYIRNSPQYIVDTFKYFGCYQQKNNNLEFSERNKVFDLKTDRGGPIVGGESVQNEILRNLESFVRSGSTSKLILLHGPNGSAKSSTVEAIAKAMEEYSHTEEGVVYRFNWIFPTDKDSMPTSNSESQPIGFGTSSHPSSKIKESYALLDETKISSKITSEFKENPLFLLPMPYRKSCLLKWISDKEGTPIDQIELPPHILANNLSKKNQQIFENLLNAYNGNIAKVFKHIQVERFFYSKQYRVGISTIEPQMTIDAREKQLTLDKNYSNLPAVLHTINFYQSEGELVEANRGILEFSDLLKRPIESFKYLLSTIEQGCINLSSGTALLDTVFIGTTNEKHLDSFKTIPDFSSFKGRFELITVPYLLNATLEEHIYAKDVEAISKSKIVSPHSLSILCKWAVMTRLKQPDRESFASEYHAVISKLEPYYKSLLYENKSVRSKFSLEEANLLKDIRTQLWRESQGMVVYEGRFGASPREIRSILHRASQNRAYKTVTPMAIFEELDIITKDRTVYEFLQFEPRAQYHDSTLFISILKEEFIKCFESEVIDSMSMAKDDQYDSLLSRYVAHVVAEIKKERIWDESTSSYLAPSQKIMSEVEKLLKLDGSTTDHRANLLSRIAAYKLENPDSPMNIPIIFSDYLEQIRSHFYHKKRGVIEQNYKAILSFANNDLDFLSTKEIDLAKNTFDRLQTRYGYDQESAHKCLQFLVQHKKIASKRQNLEPNPPEAKKEEASKKEANEASETEKKEQTTA